MAIPGGGFRIATGYLRVTATTQEAERETNRFLRDTEWRYASGGKKSGKDFSKGFVAGFLPQMRAFLPQVGRLADDLSKRLVKAVKPALQLLKFGAIAGVVGWAIGALAAGVGRLMAVIQELAHVIVVAAGSLLLLPGALMAAVGAFAVLKIGMSGFGSALKALGEGDADKIAEAMAKLAPNARTAALAVHALSPAFASLKLGVQQKLFEGMASAINRLGTGYLPVLRDGLGLMAIALNGTIRGGVDYLTQAGTKMDWTAILANSAWSVGNLGEAFKSLLRIITDATVVSSEAFARITEGAGAAVARWADYIAAARASGRLGQLINDGVVALKALGRMLMDVGGIIKGIFSAAGSGGGMLTFLHRLNETINSIAGQTALKTFFEQLARVGDAVTPVLVALMQALGPVATGIADIATAWSPALVTLVTALGTALSLLAPGLVGLAPGIGAASGALEPIGDLISGVLTPMGDLISQLGPVLIPLFADLAESAGNVLVPALAAMTPVVVDLAKALAPIAGALAWVTDGAVGVELGIIATALVGVKVGTELWAGAVWLLDAAMAANPVGLVIIAIAALVAVILLIATKTTWFQDAWNWAWGGIKKAALAVWDWLSKTLWPGITGFFGAIGDAIGKAVDYFVALPGKIWNALTALPGILKDAASKAFDLFFEAVGFGLGTIYGLLTGTPTRVGEIFHTMWTTAIGWVVGMWDSIKTTFMDGVNNAIDWVVGMADKIWAWFIEMKNRVVSTVVGMLDDAITWLMGLGPRIIEALNDLPAKIKAAVSGAKTWLVDTGKNILRGLWDGITQSWDWLMGKIGGIGDSIMKGFNKALDSHSPSRLMARRVGRPIAAGIAVGMEEGAPDLYRSMAGLLASLTAAGPNAAAGRAASSGMPLPAAGGPVHVTVMLGDRVMEDLVQDVIVNRPNTVAAATDVGHQRRAFAGTRNRLVATA
jgi:phage-related protein